MTGAFILPNPSALSYQRNGTTHSFPAPGSKLKILSIDGGAMKGAVPARILSYLDGSIPNTDNPNNIPSAGSAIYEMFDLIIGTSTGGILAAGLTIPTYTNNSVNSVPQNADELLGLYQQSGSQIFPQADFADIALLSGPMFSDWGLASTVQNYWGAPSGIIWGNPWTRGKPPSPPPAANSALTLAEAMAPLMITTFNANQTGNTNPSSSWNNKIDGNTPFGPVILNNTTATPNGSLSALQACLMTSAFPLLLPPVPYDLHFAPKQSADTVDYFLDGGMWAGNPTMAVYEWAIANGYEIELLLSIGCGAYSDPVLPNYATANSYGSGVSYAVNKNLGNPGWLITDRESRSDGGVSDFSELGYLMGAGGAIAGTEFLSAAISNAGGTFTRLNPPLSNAALYPPYDWNGVPSWITAADMYVGLLYNNGDNGNAWSQIVQAVGASEPVSA